MAVLVITPEIEAAAQHLADATGTTPGEVIAEALRQQAVSLPKAREPERPEEREARLRDIDDILRWFHALPWDETKTADDILGYDEYGLPT